MKKLKFLPQFKPIKVLLGMIVSFVLILSYIVACSDNDPIEDQPLPDPIADEIPDPIADEDLITVDTDGGVFILPSGIEVTVPQGAVTTEKEMKVEVLDLTAVNALAPSPSSENTSILSGISFATDVFDFKEPISLKIPVQNIKAKSLAFLYEFKDETNKWQFSDETMIVSRQDNFVELNLKASDQNSVGKGEGLAAQTPLVDDRFFLVRLFDGIFENEDSCREAAIKAVSTAIDNAESEGCDATMVHEDITFLECGPSVTEAYVALSFSDDCKPELEITPAEDLKVKKGESLTINLFTSIGNFPLSQQKIELTPNDNVGVGTTPIFTDSQGKKSFSVTGSEVGDGKVDVSVTFSYYSTTIYASNAELEEYSPYDPESGEFDITLNIEVYEKLKVLTDAVTNVTSKTAIVSGNVTDDGGETVTERGVYWGKSADPENKLPLGSGLGGFIGNLTDLEPDTDYYVKAYAINNKEETAEGEIVSFKTLEEKCEVTTSLDTDYECDSATVGGNVTCEGDAIATERGIYIDGVKMQSGSGTGSFSVDLTDLEENTSYTVQAYVTSDADIELGEPITFTTPECELIDIDGNVYKTVKIGTQVWMAENLKTTTYNDGSSIVLETDPWEWQRGEPKYSWYNNDISNKDVYGALYNWFAVYTGKLCPLGWHVSSSEEYQTLMEYVGGPDIAAGKLKETGTSHWFPPNTGATDEYGFTALPGGYRKGFHVLTYEDGDEDFRGLGEHGVWWTSTAYGSRRISGYAFGMSYDYEDSEMGPSNSGGWGYCVRCVKD